MALRYSSALRNFLNQGGSIKQALANGKILIYSGTQPASANDAVSGTLLATITSSSGAHTNEVLATGSLTISGTTSGSVDSVTIDGVDILGGAVTHTGAVNSMAVAVAAAINNNPANHSWVASATGASGVVTITAKPGFGTLMNGATVSATATTTTVGTFVDIGDGVAGVSPVNGLRFGASSAGTLVKHPDQTWSGVAAQTGTAGWFRFCGSIADAGSADSSEVYIRLDGNIATSGANLNLSSTSVVTGATQTINTFSLTLPASA